MSRKIRSRADGAWLHLLNNPMPRLVRGLLVGTGYDRVVGHCHGTIGMIEYAAKLLEMDRADVDIAVAGINHFHLVQRLTDKRDGHDLLEDLRHLPEEKVEQWKREDYTLWSPFDELGYLIGHGIWHNYDYLPYANRRIFRNHFYNTWPRLALAQRARRTRSDEEVNVGLETEEAVGRYLQTPELEQMFVVMQALSGHTEPFRFLSGNMPNDGRISGLPDEAIVELPATVTPGGVELHEPEAPLPLLLEGWMRQHCIVAELSVRATLEGSRQLAIEAIAADPSFRDCTTTAGELLDAMLAVNAGLVPNLSSARARARYAAPLAAGGEVDHPRL